jgi:hypothetical protein
LEDQASTNNASCRANEGAANTMIDDLLLWTAALKAARPTAS